MSPRPRKSTLFPYTTLFRSLRGASVGEAADVRLSRAAECGRALVSLRRADRPPLLRRARIAHDVSLDRKSTRLNSSHGYISYAVFCLKKKIRSIGRATTP